jgi:hypothetical protein
MRWRVPGGNPACEGQPKPDAARKPPPHLQQTKICCGAKVLVASAHQPFYLHLMLVSQAGWQRGALRKPTRIGETCGPAEVAKARPKLQLSCLVCGIFSVRFNLRRRRAPRTRCARLLGAVELTAARAGGDPSNDG